MNARRSFLTLMLAAIVCWSIAAPVLAQPAIERVDPSAGRTDAATRIVVSGSGFDPESWTALVPGGPFLSWASKFYLKPESLMVAEGRAHLRWSRTECSRGGCRTSWGCYTFDLSELPSEVAAEFPATVGDTPCEPDPSAGHRPFAFEVREAGAGASFLLVEDRSDPDRPVTVASLRIDGSPLETLLESRRANHAIAGDRGYVFVTREGNPTVVIVDLQDPRRPSVVREAPLPAGIAAAFPDFLAVLASRPNRVHVLDARDPSRPPAIEPLPIGGDVLSVAPDGRLLYAVVRLPIGTYFEVVVLDLADPKNPRWVGATAIDVTALLPDAFIPFDSSCVMTVQAGLAHAWCGGMPGGSDGGATEGAYFTVDVSTPISPGLPREVPVERATSMQSAGDTLYVATLDGDLAILDVADPGAPALLGRISLGAPIDDVAVSGSRAYVGPPLRVVDVSDPRAPRGIGESAVASTRLAARGNLVFALVDGEFRIVDATDAAAPSIVGGLPRSITGRVTDVEMAGDHAVLSACSVFAADCPTQFLHVIDISDPSLPFILGSATTSSHGTYQHRLAVEGRRVIALRAGNSEVIVDAFDLADPTTPAHLGRWSGWARTSASQVGFVAVGDRAFANLPGLGVTAFRLDESGVPDSLGFLRGVGAAIHPGFGLEVIGEYLFAGDNGPMRIVRLTPELAETTTISDTTIVATVPPGMEPGPYDALVANGDGSRSVRPNAFRICSDRELNATLAPVRLPSPQFGEPMNFVGSRPSLRWRLSLDGDQAFFDPPSHGAHLSLAALPAQLSTRFVQGDGTGRMSIDLRIAGETGIGEIVLTGDDRSTVEALWADAKKAGSIPMPRFDDRRYGDVVLEVHAAGRTGRPTSVVPSPSAGTLPAPFDHFVRYRYEFVGDRLDAARAWGAGADFQIVARATDRLRCEFADSVGFVDSFRAVCAELLAAYPNFLWLCP